MGYDSRESSSSSAVMLTVILLVAAVGMLAVIGAAVFWVHAARTQAKVALVAQQRALEAELKARALAEQAIVEARRLDATPDPRLNFAIRIDQAGHALVESEPMDLVLLREQLIRRQEETNYGFTVRIAVDPRCPFREVAPVIELCQEIGDLDYVISTTEIDE